MKKLFIAGLMIFAGVMGYAFQPTWTSSTTATADTTKNLCIAVSTNTTLGTHADFHGVCVSSAVAPSSVSVFASSAASTSPVAIIDGSKTGCYYYDVQVSSGLTYTTSSTSNVTIMYQCY